jgi:hypothetical protein
MYELKKFGKVFTSKFVGLRALVYKKKLPNRGLTKVEKLCPRRYSWYSFLLKSFNRHQDYSAAGNLIYLNISKIRSRIEPVTFRLVAECLD